MPSALKVNGWAAEKFLRLSQCQMIFIQSCQIGAINCFGSLPRDF